MYGSEKQYFLNDMPPSNTKKPRILIVYYSFSGQISGLVHHIATGIRESGVHVVQEKIQPRTALRFPVGTIPRTIKMMVTTLFRQRIEIKDLSKYVEQNFDLIILAGPTWSYNPSGPILSFLDRYGRAVLGDRKIVPLISCRGYWRLHWQGLQRLISRCGGNIVNHMVFSHPSAEPWRTLGVFLKIAGKAPERSVFFGRWYKRFGHSREQYELAEEFGRAIGTAVKGETDLEKMDFQRPEALP